MTSVVSTSLLTISQNWSPTSEMKIVNQINQVKNKTFCTIMKTVETSVSIATTSSFVTISKTGFGFVATTISTGIF